MDTPASPTQPTTPAPPAPENPTPTPRVLAYDEATRRLRALAVAGHSRRDAVRRLFRAGLLVPIAGASPDDPPPPPDPKPGDKPPADPPKPDDDPRVPKSRLDAEAEKRREAEREAADLRKRLEDAEAKDMTDREKAEKDRDKATQRAEAAEAKWRDAMIRSYAVEKNAIDPDAIVALLASDSTIKFGEDATVKAAVERIAEEKKPLFGEGAPAGGVGLPGGGSSSAPGAGGAPGDAEDEKLGMGRDLLGALTGKR